MDEMDVTAVSVLTVTEVGGGDGVLLYKLMD